jgi:hypothetical protein
MKEVYRCFGGTYYLYFQGQRLNQGSNEKAGSFLLIVRFLDLFFNPEVGGSNWLRNAGKILEDFEMSHPKNNSLHFRDSYQFPS